MTHTATVHLVKCIKRANTALHCSPLTERGRVLSVVCGHTVLHAVVLSALFGVCGRVGCPILRCVQCTALSTALYSSLCL